MAGGLVRKSGISVSVGKVEVGVFWSRCCPASNFQTGWDTPCS